jgi:hypothetical protein
MPKITPTRVKKQTGLNPVAQAIAREVLRKSILDQKIQFYTTQEDEPCVDFCVPILMMFCALISTAKIDPKIKSDNYEVRILRGAVSALEQMIADNLYRRVNIVSLELALDCAYELIGKINPTLFNQEWNKITSGT